MIGFCDIHKTVETILPRLLWLNAQLARANHFGATEQAWMAEMQVLGAGLMDEDAPLVCWADLHLAVNATNPYDFARATRHLDRWRDLPPSVPGLRYRAQLRSSLGPHAAFLDRPEQARACFMAMPCPRVGLISLSTNDFSAFQLPFYG